MSWPYKSQFWLQDTKSCFSGIDLLIVYTAQRSDRAFDTSFGEKSSTQKGKAVDPHTNSAKMGSFKIGRKLFMAEKLSVELRSNFSQCVELQGTGGNWSGVQRTTGRLRTTSNSVPERPNFREIDYTYLKFSQFLVS